MNINEMPKDVVYIIIVGWGIVVTIILVIVFWPKPKKPFKNRQESNEVTPHRPSLQAHANTSKRKRGGSSRRRP
jgi:hypothetical protein